MGFRPNILDIEFLASLSTNVSWLVTAALVLQPTDLLFLRAIRIRWFLGCGGGEECMNGREKRVLEPNYSQA